MPDWLGQILDWIGANPHLAGVAIGLVAFLEGLAVVGILVPGIIILFGFGALIGLGVLDLASVWIWCSVGAILGDGLSFALGYFYKDSIQNKWPFSRFPELFSAGKQFFRKHGLKSIIIGRFVGPVRPIIPVIAGMLHMAPQRYIPANVLAGVFWAPAYLLPGVVFGASLELAQAVALRLAAVLTLLFGGLWLIWYVVVSIYQLLAPRGSRMLNYALRWSQRHPHLGRFASPLVDPNRPESGSLIVLAGLLLIAAWGLITLLIAVPLKGGPLALDEAIRTSMGSLANPWTDRLLLFFSGLGDWHVLLPLTVAVLAWLLVRRRRIAATHWIVAVGVGFLLSLLIGWLVGASRGAPSGAMLGDLHLSMSVVVYGFFTIAIARELPRKNHRAWPYVIASLVVGMIGFARLYFGLHWASDLLIGALLGMTWILIVGIAYRRRSRRSFWTIPPAVMFYLLVVALGAMNLWQRGDAMLGLYRPTAPAIELNDADWQRSGWQVVDRNGERPLNVQYLGDPDRLKTRLIDNGWQVSETADWSILLQWLQPEPTRESLPVLPSAWRGQPEDLVLSQSTANGQRILRLWQVPRRGEQFPLIVGSVISYELTTSLYAFTYWTPVAASDDLTGLLSLWQNASVVQMTDQAVALLR